MEIKISTNAAFWFGYALFCIVTTGTLELLGMIALSGMDKVEQAIFVSSLIASGVVMRYWVRLRFKDGTK